MYNGLIILHLVGLALGLGGALAGRFLGTFSSSHTDVDFKPLMKKYSLMNAFGLLLLIITGFAMAALERVNLESNAFQIKIMLVGFLVLLSGFMHMNQGRYFRTGNTKLLMMNKRMQPIALVLTLSILVFAVYAFNG